MANWKALNWAESEVSTGKSGARAMLTQLCLKCDDDGRVFRTIPDLGKLCEMKERAARDHVSYLERIGLVTQIQRMRPNKSETRSVLLLNYPEAPHLNGEVTVLDYFTKTGPRVMYPKNPIGLLDLGVAWSSNGVVYGVHQDHQDEMRAWREEHAPGSGGEEHEGGAEGGADSAPQGGADSAGGRGAESAPPATREDGETSTVEDAASGEQNLHPQGSTNQSFGGQSPTSEGDGWLDGSSAGNNGEPGAMAGHHLLSELGVCGKALTDWSDTVTDALLVLGKDATRTQLGGGKNRPGPGAIVTTRLPGLARQLAHARKPKPSAQPSPTRSSCSRCRARRDSSKIERTIQINPTDPGSPEVPCPSCRPDDYAEKMSGLGLDGAARSA